MTPVEYIGIRILSHDYRFRVVAFPHPHEARNIFNMVVKEVEEGIRGERKEGERPLLFQTRLAH